jgi:hypothetical protein
MDPVSFTVPRPNMIRVAVANSNRIVMVSFRGRVDIFFRLWQRWGFNMPVK